MNDHGISLNQHCPCVQRECPILGNCVLCVQNHLENKKHIPECVQNILRPAVQALAKQMELRTEDSRPTPQYWAEFDEEKRSRLLQRSIARHTAPKDESE
jgi:hemolysin-activating ACP:hemolysin acyltransferase